MSLASQIDRLKQRSAEDRNAGHGYPATFRGQSIRVGLSAITISMDLEMGGYRQGGQFICRFLASSLQSPPRANEQILISGKTYTISVVAEALGTPVEYVATIVPGSAL
jgi:hypothetical protein